MGINGKERQLRTTTVNKRKQIFLFQGDSMDFKELANLIEGYNHAIDSCDMDLDRNEQFLKKMSHSENGAKDAQARRERERDILERKEARRKIAEERKLLYSIIDSLPYDKPSNAVRYKVINGLSFKEIAIKLGYQSEAVAKQTCYRKINQLNEGPEIKARIRELGKQKSTERRLSIFGD